MTEIAHRGDAGHASAAFECMQVTFELVHGLPRIFRSAPVAKCLVHRLEQLRRLFGEYRCNLGVVFRLRGYHVCGYGLRDLARLDRS